MDVVRSAEAMEIQRKELDCDSPVHGLEKKKNKLQTKRHPQIMKKKDLRARSSIARTAEPDIV